MSPELPLHVALVHVPLGGSVLVPLIVAVLLIVPRDDRRTWWVAVLLQAAVVVGGFVAAATGEDQALAVQFLVDAAPIEAHEDAGHVFLAASAAVLAALAVGAAGRTAVRRRRAAAAALILGLLAAGLGIRAGHLGGELVFVHGAVRAHESAGVPPSAP